MQEKLENQFYLNIFAFTSHFLSSMSKNKFASKPHNSLNCPSNSLCSTPTPCKLRGVCFKQSLRGVTRAFYKVKNRGQVFKTMGNTKTLLYRTLHAILDSAKSSVRS